MARGGFFSRIGRVLRDIVAPRQREEEPREEEPPPPSPRDYRREWNRYSHKRTENFQKNLDVFHNAIDSIEPDPQEQLDLWKSYVRHIVKGQGRFRRQDNQNMFWRDSGMDPRDWDWTRWRAAMGYVGKNRSRTT